MRRHPYIGLPDRQFWKKEPGIENPALFDPVAAPTFSIGSTDRVVTAGSCFAQHVARRLTNANFNHFIAEAPHPIFTPQIAAEFNYGVFAARYGNIYTARQFLQLLTRAWGKFTPREVSWPRGDNGRVVDPFRPQIQPNGFISEDELVQDRLQHFAAIRRAITEMDVLVFTLGLTECWEDVRDGAIYPLAPGVAGGVYSSEKVRFTNFDEVETTADLLEALAFVRSVNPTVRIILTVSPVPLNATMESRHVMLSTTWSKAVLRIAAERAANALDDCIYFPSYEIITSPLARGLYFASDGREVLDAGVSHVMRLFFKHFAGSEVIDTTGAGQEVREVRAVDAHADFIENQLEIQCDEEAIQNH